MEYWSVEKDDISPLVITPTLQHTNALKFIDIESPRDGLISVEL